MRYMVVETFRGGNAKAVYQRFKQFGRLAPERLTYVASWVSADGDRCWQIMECEERRLLDEWIARWVDVIDFDVVPIISSAEAAERFG